MTRSDPAPPLPDQGLFVWLAVVAVALLACHEFVPSLMVAFVVAILCRPFFSAANARIGAPEFMRGRPAAARIVASILTQLLACLLVLMGILAPLFFLSLNRTVIARSVEGAYAGSREWSRKEIQSWGTRLHVKAWTAFSALPSAASLAQPAPAGINSAPNMLDKAVEIVSQPAPFVPSLIKMLGGGAMLLGKLMFFFLALHFLLLYGPGLWRDMLSQSPPVWRPTLASLGARTRTVVTAVFVVHGLTACSAFLLALPVFWVIVGVKYFVLAALLTGLFQFVPAIGSAVFVGLLTLYFFSKGEALQGSECLFLAFPIIVGVPDLFVRPYLAGRFGRIHALTMLVGFIVGLEVFGPLGFILGPVFLDLIAQFTQQVRGAVALPAAAGVPRAPDGDSIPT